MIIARELGMSENTVRNIIHNYREYGTIDPRPKSGRPRKTTERGDRRIIREARTNPFTTSPQITSNLDIDITPVTIRNRLHKSYFESISSFKKTVLT